MSTPPNPPGTPSGPPPEPADAPIPGAEKPSLEKPSLEEPRTDTAASAPEPAAPVSAPEPVRPSLTKTPPADAPPAEAPPADAAPADAPPADAPPAQAQPAQTPPADAPPADIPPAPAPTPPPGEFDPWAAPAPGAAPPQFPPSASAPPTGAWGQPAPPTGAWGHVGPPPAPPYAAYPGYAAHPGFRPAPVAPSNGMAVAALVLGLVAVPVAIVPFVFWIGALLGMTALGLGIAALVRALAGAPRKVMSLVGAGLGLLSLGACAGGWFLTVAVVDRAVERAGREITVDPEWDEEWDQEWDEDDLVEGDEDAALPPSGPGITTPLDFGRTYTYPSGIQVRIAEPRKYTTSSKWIEVGNAVRVDFTITNTSDRPHRVIHAIPAVVDDQGRPGKLVFDGRMPKRVETVIEPGHSASGSAAFEVPEGTKSISADLSPGVLLPPAKFTGPVR